MYEFRHMYTHVETCKDTYIWLHIGQINIIYHNKGYENLSKICKAS